MSAKWRRVQAWDRENLTGVMTPVRLVLHSLSTIALAVVLLTGVAVYSVLASVPIGLLVLGLTWLVYVASLVLAAALPAAAFVVPTQLLVKPRLLRFGISLLGLIGGATIGVLLWLSFAWPALQFDPADGTGVRFFPEFVETYRNITLRRLPMFEMTELEFYAWWPMQAMLGLFVINMVVATIRRIEFSFVNIGVLTVHTGIVLIAVGSIYYQAFKQEGDTILLAGDPGSGSLSGQAQQMFYDREDPALMVFDGRGWRQLPLVNLLPRYNDYDLDAGVEESAKGTLGFGAPISTATDQERTLTIDLTSKARALEIIPDNVSLRVVGYATYAEPVTDWVNDGTVRNPLRMVYLIDNAAREKQLEEQAAREARRAAGDAAANSAAPEAFDTSGRLVGFAMLPSDPEFAAVEYAGVVGVEYHVDMPEDRWSMLTTEARGMAHAVIAEVDGERLVISADRPGRTFELAGWQLTVEEVLPEPPFPIVTDGYQDATSALAIVRVTSPEGKTVRRWVYHRFPVLNQDIGENNLEDGRPDRSDPDERLKLTYIDQSKIQVYVNERGDTGLMDVAFRFADGLDVRTGLRAGSTYQTPVDRIAFEFADRWDRAREVERPSSVPLIDREGDFIGTNDRAMIAVEVSTDQGFSQTVWLPFARYAHDAGTRGGSQRTITLPDGRPVSLMFGRQWFSLPGFQLRLIDFEMIAYDHRGAPRDYQSLVRVEPATSQPSLDEPYDHITKLNAPLKAPFLWSDARGLASNVAGELISHLSPRQFKFSQAGWDRSGWEESQAEVDAGVRDRPTVRFTILGVGNNPGIHVIAFGGVLMGVGIPWAFYVKPWLVKRQKQRMQRERKERRRSPQLEPVSFPETVGAAT
ncbi:MAG: hypothetical protein AAGJ54_09465 [Planctomycetota bacterium]